MTINPQAVFETTWWEHCGETPWEDIPGCNRGRRKSAIFRCLETGEEKLSHDLPVGALYTLDREGCTDINGWPPAAPHDGLAIACVCLGRGGPETRYHWHIESRASNCTLPGDKEHRCWVRHGTVGEKLTVDKNGKTCAAGAGSFFMGPNQEWHGFLRAGRLTP